MRHCFTLVSNVMCEQIFCCYSATNFISWFPSISYSAPYLQKRKLSDMLGPQWSKEELERFYEGYRKFGKEWKKVSSISKIDIN